MQRQDVGAGVPSHLDRLVTVFLENISATLSTAYPHIYYLFETLTISIELILEV